MMFRLARIAGIISNRVMITFGLKPVLFSSLCADGQQRPCEVIYGDNMCPFFCRQLMRDDLFTDPFEHMWHICWHHF